jgi:hypothetical protein
MTLGNRSGRKGVLVVDKTVWSSFNKYCPHPHLVKSIGPLAWASPRVFRQPSPPSECTGGHLVEDALDG